MSALFKEIHRFNTIPNKIPMPFFTELEQIVLKFVWKHKRPWRAKAILRKKTQSLRHHALWLQIVLQSSSNQNSMIPHKNRNIDQWSSIESTKINSRTYGKLIYDKGGKNIQWKKDSLFNKWCCENWQLQCQNIKSEHSFTLYTKINSKWTKDLNVRLEIIKLLEENIGRAVFDIRVSNIFLDCPFKQRKQKDK